MSRSDQDGSNAAVVDNLRRETAPSFCFRRAALAFGFQRQETDPAPVIRGEMINLAKHGAAGAAAAMQTVLTLSPSCAVVAVKRRRCKSSNFHPRTMAMVV